MAEQRQERMIDYVEMPATDIKAVQSFFSELFGWKFTDYGPDYCDFQDGRISGGFYRSEQVMAADAGSALVVFYARDLQQTLDKVVSLGGEISKPVFSFPGGRRFHFKAPGGNEFAVWSDNE